MTHVPAFPWIERWWRLSHLHFLLQVSTGAECSVWGRAEAPTSRQHREQSFATVLPGSCLWCQGVGALRNHQYLTLCVSLGRLGLLSGQEMLQHPRGKALPAPSNFLGQAGGAAHKGERVWRWGGEQQRWFPGETALRLSAVSPQEWKPKLRAFGSVFVRLKSADPGFRLSPALMLWMW